MSEEDLAGHWETLTPTQAQRRRIDAQVFAWLEARDTPLVVEWFRLVRVAPVPAFGFAMVSAISIAITPPFVWVARALL